MSAPAGKTEASPISIINTQTLLLINLPFHEDIHCWRLYAPSVDGSDGSILRDEPFDSADPSADHRGCAGITPYYTVLETSSNISRALWA